MVNFMQRLSTSIPPPTSFRDDKPALLVSWWCTLYALVIIYIRILGRYMRTKKIFLDDKVMILAIIPLIARMCCETTVVTHGTNNVETESLTEAQIRSREWGSKMVLVSRILYISFLWTIKYSISIFLRTLTSPIWTRQHQAHLGYLHIFLFLTLVTSIVSVLAPCRPFNHFWQVVPDPGTQCRQNYVYVFTTGSLNVLTNIVLVVFPIPMVLMSGLLLKQYVNQIHSLDKTAIHYTYNDRKVNILLRLSLPIFPIVLTLYVIPTLCGRDPFATSHIRRTLLGSIDILLTAFSANAVVLFSFLQDKGVKKSKFRHMQEGFHTNRFADRRRSCQSGSMEIANVGLCDVGNLLQKGKLGKDIDLRNDSGTNQPSSKAGHQSTCLGKKKKKLPNDKKDISTTQENETEQRRIKLPQLGIDSNQCQQELVDKTNDHITESSGQAKRYLNEITNKGSYSNSLSDGENKIIPPSPVYFGEIRLTNLQEIHLEDWSSREWDNDLL